MQTAIGTPSSTLGFKPLVDPEPLQRRPDSTFRSRYETWYPNASLLSSSIANIPASWWTYLTGMALVVTGHISQTLILLFCYITSKPLSLLCSENKQPITREADICCGIICQQLISIPKLSNLQFWIFWRKLNSKYFDR